MIVRRARWRLTLGFTAVQLLTYAVFAIAVYVYVTSTFDFDGIEDGGSPQTAEAGFATLQSALLLAFIGLLVVAPVSSWVLAGVAMRPVAATLEAQRRFVDDASHELRTPLTAIQAQLELALLRPRRAEEYRRACEAALDATHALAAIAADLIASSEGIHAKRGDDSVELAPAVGRAVALLPDPGRVEIEVASRPMVAISDAAAQRALVNVLVNACRYSDPASLVSVRVSNRGRWGLVDVVDRGIGMSADQTRHAFDRFWQADPSRSAEGSGLGLSIVRDICASVGGKVSISSEPGVGTTVSVSLPLSRSSHDARRTVDMTAHPV